MGRPREPNLENANVSENDVACSGTLWDSHIAESAWDYSLVKCFPVRVVLLWVRPYSSPSELFSDA